MRSDPTSLRARFPGAVKGVARFDGPAGTLMVDRAVEAIHAHLRDGDAANLGGPFEASRRTGELVDRARRTVGELLGAPPEGIVFGANMTTLTMAFTRAVARDLGPSDEVVCTRLDHDANVTPWVLAAADRGARVVFAEIDPATGTLSPNAVAAAMSDRTRWVAVSGASNLLGSIPDIAAITALAHGGGARVFVDAVHLAPHRRVDVAAIGCDVLATSPYKWYGPHAGVLAIAPDLLASLEPYKVRPAKDVGPGRLETGTPSFEAIAGIDAAARFLLDTGLEAIGSAETAVFERLLDGLRTLPRVTVHGPQGLADRTPTVLFSVAGVHADDAAKALADARVAVWAGHSYAVEAAAAMGLDADAGIGVRAGVVAYVDDNDVTQLLEAVAGL